jgi:formylglycine-generating enzyme required for sulfatase activity
MYASPQQKRGLKADVRDDVYALGVIGYQLLLADLGAERPAGKWRKRVADCGLPDAVLDLLESCWDDDPDERPRDALTLAEALGPRQPVSPAVKPPKVGDTITNALGMKFAWVPPGMSWLGGGGGKPGPQEFTLPKGLWCGVYPVTQAEWQAVMGNNPSHFGGNPRHPVEQVSWKDAQRFLAKLNQRLSSGGLLYRLPSEQEWEYICRGGAVSREQSAYHFYFARSRTDLTPAPTNDLSGAQAHFGVTTQSTSEVGLHLPNPLGIHDLHGNVWEWTSSQEGAYRVNRGGSWANQGRHCSASDRGWNDPRFRRHHTGFRLLAIPSD